MQKNAIVIMMDSLQFNYLGCYGNDWIKTPNIDRFAREGVLFENMYIEGLPTVPCRRAMHTGRYTLPRTGWTALTLEETTIADLCWGRPIDTALIFDCPMYRLPKFGYTRAFDKVWFLHGHEGDQDFYAQDPLIHLNPMDFIEDHVAESVDRLYGEKVMSPLLHETTCYLKHRQYWKSEEDQNVAKVAKKTVEYLENIDRGKSFYLWVDSFDPHEPWDPPSVYDADMKCPYNPDYKGKDQFLPIMGPVEGVYTEEELHHIRMLYAEKVSMVDRWIGYILDNIKRLGLEENTMIMLVSDHGEPMGNAEHGHGIMRKCRPWPYEELVHAPFLMKAPGLPAGSRVKGYAQSVDVAPTVLDWLGVGAHPTMEGESLLPLAKGDVEKVRDFAVAGYHKYSWSLINDDWSYVHWLKADEKTIGESLYGIILSGIEQSASHLNFYGDGPKDGDMYSDASQKMRDAASLDSEEMWTCTPGSMAETPKKHELYCRKNDPFQLKNVIDDNPQVAEELREKLRTFMAELKTS